MTEAELDALLDAHDALAAACIDGSLALADAAAAYGGFPQSYALDDSDATGRGLSPSRRRRVDFHALVAGVLSGTGSPPFAPDDLPGGGEDFMSRVVVMRLRQLVARHPGLTAE